MSHQRRKRRFAGGIVVEEKARAFSFKESDPPAVAMRIRCAATGLKAGKGKADVGGDIAIHSKKLADGSFSLLKRISEVWGPAAAVPLMTNRPGGGQHAQFRRNSWRCQRSIFYLLIAGRQRRRAHGTASARDTPSEPRVDRAFPGRPL